MRSPDSNSRALTSPLQSWARDGQIACVFGGLPNLIQQRSSAFAMGVGKPQKPVEPVSVFHRIEPKFSGQSSMQYRPLDILHLSVRPFRVIWEARDEVA